MPVWELIICLLPNVIGFVLAAVFNDVQIIPFGMMLMITFYFANKLRHIEKCR